MNSVNLSHLKQSQVDIQTDDKQKPITSRAQNAPLCDSDLTQDVFEPTHKNKKKNIAKNIFAAAAVLAAIAGIAIVAFTAIKKNKVAELSYDEFKKIGGTFDKGKAINKSGKPFSGKLIKKTAKGDKFVVEYKNGLTQKSTKNFSELVDKYSTKEYSYSKGGKLKEVVSKEFEINENAKNSYLKLDENVRQCVNKSGLYNETMVSKTLYDDKKIKTFVTDFAQTAEGKRRAQMSDEDILAETQKLFDDILAKKGIDKTVAPKVKIIPDDLHHGGSYNQNTNVLELNPNSFRAGKFNLEDVVMHETTHFEEALLRSRLDDDVVAQATKNKLTSRIFKGEADEVIVSGGLLGTKTVKTPKLSEKMKKEFQEFATDNLYTNDDEFRRNIVSLANNEGKAQNAAQEKIMSKISKLIDDNPDFVKQYSSKEEAAEMLANYSASHCVRFSAMTDRSKIDVSGLPKLTLEEEKRALDSLDGYLETVEGNARMSGFRIFGNTKEEFNNYQFSREEVLAQKNGNAYAIEKIKAKKGQMKKDGTLTPQFEAYFDSVINKSGLTIEYKTKGQVWYQKYIESLNNPDNVALKEAVEKEWEELAKISEQIQNPLIPTGVWERVKK